MRIKQQWLSDSEISPRKPYAVKCGPSPDIKEHFHPYRQREPDKAGRSRRPHTDFKPELVINVALTRDLRDLDACLAEGVNYLDSANYEPKDKAHFEYSWRWAYRPFQKAGIMALLGSGFDPGVSNVYVAYAKSTISTVWIRSTSWTANAGNHGKAFATNFNPKSTSREYRSASAIKDGIIQGSAPIIEEGAMHKPVNYPQVGDRESYLLYHEGTRNPS